MCLFHAFLCRSNMRNKFTKTGQDLHQPHVRYSGSKHTLPFTFGTNRTRAAETCIVHFTAGTISWNFITPVVREFCLMHGMCDVSRKTMVELLSTPGRALMVAIGGASEALLAAPGTMDLILNKRQCLWPVLPFFSFCPALPVLLSYWWLQYTPRHVPECPWCKKLN